MESKYTSNTMFLTTGNLIILMKMFSNVSRSWQSKIEDVKLENKTDDYNSWQWSNSYMNTVVT